MVKNIGSVGPAALIGTQPMRNSPAAAAAAASSAAPRVVAAQQPQQPVRQPPITGPLDTPKKLQAYLNLCPRELTEIELHNAKITTKSLQGIRFPPGLKELNLEQNQITSMEGVQFPPGLTELVLMQNQIVSLSGVKFPRGLKRLDLSNNKIWTLSGIEFPPTLEDLDLEDNPLRDLGTAIDHTQMINPNKYVIEYLKRNFAQLYFRDLYEQHKESKMAEKSALKAARQSQKAKLQAARQSQKAELKTARQSQKAELHKMNDLSQQSMRTQLNAVASFLREGMQTRAEENAKQLLKVRQGKLEKYEESLFYAKLNEKTYPVPMIEELSIHDVLNYLNEHYYISVLHNCGGMHLHKPGAGKLESGRTLKECGVVSDDVLDIVCGTQKGGFARSKKRNNKRSKKHNKLRNKSTKNRT
jgi:hypothetical protein